MRWSPAAPLEFAHRARDALGGAQPEQRVNVVLPRDELDEFDPSLLARLAEGAA